MKYFPVIICLCMIILALSTCDGSEVSEQSSEVIVTNEAGERIFRDGLTLDDYINYLQCYKIVSGVDPVYLDYDTKISVKTSKQTEMVLRLWNYFIWYHYYDAIEQTDEDLKNDQLEARKIMEEYGFSKDNRVTSEWVINNPYDAYQLISQIPKSISSEFVLYPKGWCNYYGIIISDLYDKSNKMPEYTYLS